MIKVLQIIDGKQYGGICKLFLDIEKNISKDIKFEYLTATNICDSWNNLNIDRSSIKGRIIFNHRLKKYLKNNKYDIIHINSGAFFFVFTCALICRLQGIKNIVVHSHNNPKLLKIKKILLKILNPFFRKMTKIHLSCSKDAIKSLYTKSNDVIILKNGINIDDYKYDKKIREKYQKELNIIGKKVYGHIGIFNKQKNHHFLINVFNEISKKEDAVLLLIGEGELEKEIRYQVKQYGIEDKVYFLGYRNDVNKLLNCIDIFLFPSLYEGLGIVLIEAQTNGTIVFASNAIPKETNISPYYNQIDNFELSNWVNKIKDAKILDRDDAYINTINNEYDIRITSKKLELIYKEMMK